MNNEDKNKSREELEERLTALLLGEVDDKERVELERLMRENPDLARFYKEIEQTVALVRQASLVSPDVAENQKEAVWESLSVERRRKLIEHFRKPAVKEKQYAWYQLRLGFVGLLVGTLFCSIILAGLMLPAGAKAKAKAMRVTEYNRQKMMELERRLQEEDEKGKAEAAFETELASKEKTPLEAQEQTVGNVLSRSLYQRETLNQPVSQTAAGDVVAKTPESGADGAKWGFVGGVGGAVASGKRDTYAGRAVASEDSTKNVEELRRNRFAGEPQRPMAPPPATAAPTASPAKTIPHNLLADAVSEERADSRLSETPTGVAGGQTVALGDTPALGVEFSKSKIAKDAFKDAETEGKPVTRTEGTELYFYSDRKFKTSEGAEKSGAQRQLDAAGTVVETAQTARGVAIDEVKQTVADNGVAASKLEKEALKLNLPTPSLKGTPADLSAETKTRAKVVTNVIETDKSLMDKKEAKVEVNFDAPPAEKPSSSSRIIQQETLASENRFSTFSLNVSDVSFKTALATIQNRALPNPQSIREEEFVNAFNYNDPAPPRGAKIGFYWERARYPFAHNRDIVRFSVQTATLGRGLGKPMNLVILLDNSGSMERPDRVAIITEAMKVLAGQLKQGDKISVIAFARTPRLIIDGMVWGNAEAFLNRVLNLNPHGGTNLEDAMRLGYSTALKYFMPGGINRVILLTDGAANLGEVAPEVLKNMVITNRQKGIALDCFGIGWEGYNDELLEVLSRNGDGRYGFMNEPERAPIEFAEQLAGALKIAAADVKVQIEFNPSRVISYRQIGYAKHQLTKEQFRDNTVDAAEIGEAQSGNALYVIQVNPNGNGNIGFFRVRYKDPESGAYREQEWSLIYEPNVPPLEQASPSLKLAVAAGIFAEWLARNPYSTHVNLVDLERLMTGVPEVFAPNQRPRELLTMINQARMITGK